MKWPILLRSMRYSSPSLLVPTSRFGCAALPAPSAEWSRRPRTRPGLVIECCLVEGGEVVGNCKPAPGGKLQERAPQALPALKKPLPVERKILPLLSTAGASPLNQIPAACAPLEDAQNTVVWLSVVPSSRPSSPPRESCRRLSQSQRIRHRRLNQARALLAGRHRSKVGSRRYRRWPG